MANKPILQTLKDMERNGHDFSRDIMPTFSGGAEKNHEKLRNVPRITLVVNKSGADLQSPKL
jgi:hypothetical protein